MYPKYDFHVHTSYSDGESSPFDMVEVAAEKGLQATAITDHGPSLEVGIREGRIENMVKDIRILKGDSDIPVLLGIEANIIDFEGNLDIPESLEDRLDFVMAGVHTLEVSMESYSHFTRRYLERTANAMKNQDIDVVPHPFWYQKDLSVYLTPDEATYFARTAAQNDVAIELNGRYQVPSNNLLTACIEENADFILGSDAHSPDEVGQVNWSIYLLRDNNVEKERLVLDSLIRGD